jgi:hypothetical protein
MHNREMNRPEMLDSLLNLTIEKQLEWMVDLGYQLTVSARGAYAVQRMDGDAPRLMGFNELQHQVYGRLRSLRRGDEWTLASFLDGLFERAATYKVEDGLQWALQTSVKNTLR